MDEIGQRLLAGYRCEGRFGHREHLHMTWTYLSHSAGDRVLPFLEEVARSHGCCSRRARAEAGSSPT